MKKFFIAITIAAGFAACSNPKTGDVTTATTTSKVDTAGLAQFQQWKQQQENLQSNGVYNGVNEFDNANQQAAAPVRERVVERVATAPAKKRTTTKARTSTSTARTGTSNSGGGGSVVQAPAPAKKGWSKAAKGAAIGGASGAVIGAVVSKKKGLGAVIGGVVGAAGGYTIGRSKDRKDGRVN